MQNSVKKDLTVCIKNYKTGPLIHDVLVLVCYLKFCCAGWRSWSYGSDLTGKLQDGSLPILQGDLKATQVLADECFGVFFVF